MVSAETDGDTSSMPISLLDPTFSSRPLASVTRKAWKKNWIEKKPVASEKYLSLSAVSFALMMAHAHNGSRQYP